MSKISRILGVGLVVAVLASLFVATVPASAATLGWSAEVNGVFPALPIVAGSNIVDMAVAGNGTTIYAAGGTTNVTKAAGVGYLLAKSTNSGTSWAGVVVPAGVNSVSVVALAPDVTDGSYAAIITNLGIYISADGGTTWALAPTPNSANLRGIDISKAVGGGRTLAVVGDNASAGTVKLWLLGIGGLFGGAWVDTTVTVVGGWNAANFDNTAVVGLAVAVSPNYIGDRTVVIVTANPAGSKVQLANTNAMAWNGSVYASWATGAVVGGALLFQPTNGSLTLAPTYLGSDPASRIAYVGLNEPAGGTGGGLYRVSDFGPGIVLASASVNSVAVNTAGDKLVAGAAASNLVYRVAAPPTAGTASAVASSGYKSPGLSSNTNVVVAYAGTTVVAGATGVENAFATSTDDGKDFSDVALVNSAFLPVDFTVSADGSKVYLVTYSNGAVSLWKKTTAWARVFCQVDAAANNFVVRAAPENSDVVYLAEKQTATNSNVWYSNDGGATTWLPRYSPCPIVDMDVESAAVIWLAGFGGTVSKSTDSGFTYDIAAPAKILGFVPNMIDVVGANSVVVGGIAGAVSYTADGGTTWVAIPGGAGTAAVQVTADKLSTGGNIYAASGTSISRYTVGTSAAFAPIKSGTTGSATGIAFSGTTLYVTTDDGVGSSYLYRTLTPAGAVPGWNTPTAILGDITATFAGNVLRFTETPRGFWVTVGSDKNPKLWAMSNVTTIAIESLVDSLTTLTPTLTAPANGSTIQVNTQSGQAMDVAYTWSEPSTASKYDLQIALDSAFTQVLTTEVVASFAPSVVQLIGPNIAGPSGNKLVYQPDTTYYWRVRVDPAGPFDSAYSATMNFKIGSLAPLKLVTPASGASDVSVMPDYSWTAVTGATNYEIFVSDDPTFAVITFSANSDKPVYSSTEALAYSTTYYWRVRVSAPATAVSPFVYGIFTTENRPTTPTPPITITQTNTTITQTIPPPTPVIPNYLLWIIIGIGAVLVIALIVLIARTRRTG